MIRVRLVVVVVAAALLSLTLAGAARAVEPTEGETAGGGFAPAAAAGGATGFGLPGQFVVSIGAMTESHLFFHKQSGGGWQLQLQPALDYFIVPHLSVGGVVGYRHGSGGAGTGTNGAGSDTVTVGGRVGYNIDFNDKVGVWPLAGLFVRYESANHSSATNTWLALFAPFLFHPAAHFFVGAGPSFQFDLTGPMANQYGLDSFVGGWF